MSNRKFYLTMGFALAGGAAWLWNTHETRIRLIQAAILGRPITYRMTQTGGTLSPCGDKMFYSLNRVNIPPALSLKDNLGSRIYNSRLESPRVTGDNGA